MYTLDLNRKLNMIIHVFEDAQSEIALNYPNCKSMPDSQYVSKLRNQIVENIDKSKELKTFTIVVDGLMSHLTRLILQIDRLAEENVWLKDELCNLNKKKSAVDKELVSENEDLLKIKLIYEMRSLQYENANSQSSKRNDFDLIETENIFCENLSGTQKLEISKKISGLSTIIRDYTNKGQVEVAIAICKQSIYNFKLSDDKHPDIAILLCMLGFLYKDMSRWDDAADCILEALKIRENCYGANTSIVASTLNNLAIVLAGNGKYQEAESLSRKALEIREKLHGSTHESVAKQMNNLGLLLINMGMFNEGENLFNNAMNIYINLEKSELYYLKTSTNLANLYVKRMEYDKAESQLRNNLEAIYKYRFNNSTKNIIKIYSDKSNMKGDENDQICLLIDQYLVPEIVNIKFLIKLFERLSNSNMALKFKKCLQLCLPNLTDYDDEIEPLVNFSQQPSSSIFVPDISVKSKVSTLFNRLTKLMSIQ